MLKMKNEKGFGCFPWFPRVRGGEGFGKAVRMKHEKGGGCFSWFPRVGWEGLGKAQNEAWKRVCDASHGSQEWGGKGLGTLKMKHEKGVGCFSWVPRSGVGRVWAGLKWSINRGLGVLHGSQEWGGKGLGTLKMKHEKGFGCFMVPKSRVGRAWEGSKWSLKKGLGASWFGSQEWGGKGLGRFKMVSKSVVGMVWKFQKRSMKKMLKYDGWKGVWVFLMVPKSAGGRGVWESWKWNMKKGGGCFSWFPRVGWEGFGKAQNEAWKKVWVLHGSQAWGGKGLGRPKMKHEKRCWVLHGSQEWGGKGLRRFKMVPKSVVGNGLGKQKNDAWKRCCVLHGSQEWGGKGLGTLKMKHENGFGCFMAPKTGVGRVWER